MNKRSKFDKVLDTKDILAIAFGAMIGWGWVINAGDWLTNAGFIGTVVAFLAGGIVILFVGLVYAELTAAMPRCGGEHVFSYEAFGATGSFICTWSIILGYVATAAFEAAAFPTAVRYIIGDRFDIGLMYYVSGTPIYASHVGLGIFFSIFITYINIRGIKVAAVIQRILTFTILGIGVMLVISSMVHGDAINLTSNLFRELSENDSQTALGGILTVVCMTPFLFIGFDVIPQTAEEINVEYRKIGRIILMAIGMALLFYVAVVFAISYEMSLSEIRRSMSDGLVSADAMAKAFDSNGMGNVLVLGGVCGIITSWNSFFLGGSRALYAMAESGMLPAQFAAVHHKYKSPTLCILLCGIACSVAPFFGRAVLIWLVDAASFGCCIAYFIVSLSFLVLRRKKGDMERPYRIKYGFLVGTIASVLSGIMVMLYITPLPFANSTLIWQEWVVVGIWVVLGIILYFFSRKMDTNKEGVRVSEK